MKKAVTLAAIAGLSLASDFQDTEFMAHLSSKPTVNGRGTNKIFFDDDELYGESRSKLSIFNKKKGETEKTENDDELMTIGEYLKTQPKVVSIPERQILDIRTRVPVVSVLPAEQPKTEEEGENNNQARRSNFSIFDRKEGEKTDEDNHHGKATRSNFSILNRRHVTSGHVQHAKRELEDLVSQLLRHKVVKSGNELFGLRDLKKGGDKDSNKANVLKLDSEDENELYGMRDWKRGDKDSGKAGVLGLDDEEDNDLYGLRDWKKDGKTGILGLDDEEDNDLYGLRDWKKGDGKGGVLGLDDEEDNDLYGLRDWKKSDGKTGVLGLDDEEDNDLYGLKDWKRGDKDSNKAGVLGFDDEDNDLYSLRDLKRDKDSGKAGVVGLDDDEFRVLGNLIHDGLEISRDVKNKDYGNAVSHGIRKRNFLGN